MSDPYETLGVRRGAGEGEIRRRYLELVRQHPPERDAERFREIYEAYETLRDPVARLESTLFLPTSNDTITDIVAQVRRRLRLSRIPTERLLSLVER